MARATATSDVFNAVAEPARRALLELLRDGEANVTAMVESVRLTQPQVSKHLRVLREVHLVTSRSVGKERFYRIDPNGLRAMHDWTGSFEAFWNARLDRLDDLLTDLSTDLSTGSIPPSKQRTKGRSS